MIHISLFSGIGGFELAAEWMGWRNYVSCDINEFGNRVRKYYWPDGYCHTDVKTLTYEIINQELSARYGSDWRNDDIIVSGGFPCQPYSSAGKRLGKADERHLFPEMLRVISEIKPTYVVGENVYGLTNWNGGVVFEEVCADLEAIGYEVQPILLPASGIGAPHHRMRVWFVAHAISTSERADKFRSIRCPNGTNQRERTQTIHDALRPDGFKRNVAHADCNESQSNAGANGEASSNLRRQYEGDVLGEFCGDGNATDSNCRRLEGATEIGRDCEYVIGQGIFGDAADTTNVGQKYALENGELERGRFRQSYKSGIWDTFPSQSPICGGDDGLPTKLDGITFSKWRAESIKGYGNAIVPQVAMELFKQIELWKQYTNNTTI